MCSGRIASTGYSVVILAGIPNLHHAAGVRVEGIHNRQRGRFWLLCAVVGVLAAGLKLCHEKLPEAFLWRLSGCNRDSSRISFLVGLGVTHFWCWPKRYINASNKRPSETKSGDRRERIWLLGLGELT